VFSQLNKKKAANTINQTLNKLMAEWVAKKDEERSFVYLEMNSTSISNISKSSL
jgi:hypothetical protein